VSDPSSATAEAPARRVPTATRVAIGLLGVACVLTGVIAWTPFRHDPAFTYGNGIGTPPAQVGETWAIGMGTPSRDIVIDGADVQLAEGSALASLDVVVCTHGINSGVSAQRLDQLGGYCSAIVPDEGATLRTHNRQAFESLLLLVTPLEVGTVTVEGVDVHYRDGWLDRVERSGVRAEVRVS
jgi:hypothetical protein